MVDKEFVLSILFGELSNNKASFFYFPIASREDYIPLLRSSSMRMLESVKMKYQGDWGEGRICIRLGKGLLQAGCLLAS